MMKVTNKTFGMIAANHRAEVLRKAPKVQRLLKNGTWGKPFTVEFGNRETIVESLEKMNPGHKYKLAE